MKWAMIAVVAIFMIVMASCKLSPEKTSAEKSREHTTAAATNPYYAVVGYLEKREHVITIKAGPRGPVYSVATRDGKVLFEDLPSEQLKAQAPDIHELIRTGVAGDVRTRIDATLRR